MLSEDWRPDLSGVLVTGRSQLDETGSESATFVALVFASHDVIFDAGFATFVAVAVDQGRDVILGLPTNDFAGVLEIPLRVFVAQGVAAGSLAMVGEGIRRAYAELQR